ncbi:ATPase MORC2-like [Liolophura sinensis]|uniref:ATPase MORC2-like n=1 Tax=Liolophura sinensis TaxID=3198878 RepID=UPI003158498B
MSSYQGLSRAQLSFDYLHTNSTTHEFLFGALAELLDNARDASATKINIFTEPCKETRGGYYLCFLDDGEGMDPNETSDIITFGKSAKRGQDSQKIGMYGNGLKSGSMRIGNDLMLFTKKGPTMTCLFLSRSFHEEENIDEVIVPIPSFETATNRPLAKGANQIEKHNQEMNLILKYSPFKTEKEFFAKFDSIEGNCGTLVITYNLKLLDTGETELDVDSVPHDILLANPQTDFDSDTGMMPERRSFRAYAAILYMEPRMKVYIQGKKVRTKRLASCLHKCRQYKYSSNRFRSRAENEAKKAEDEAKAAENKAREAESKAKNLEGRYGSSMSREQRAELRKAQTLAAEYRKEAQIRKQIADRKTKSLKDPKTLNFIFGLNIENRSHDGVFVYNCSRLIRMYEKVGPQTDGGVCCSGIVGIVDVPYLVLEPTHNKQDFADAKEYRHLTRVMGEHMEQYWNSSGVAQQITKFWENFGYVSGNWKDPPSSEPKYLRKRHMQLSMTLQCDKCLKWRILPFSAGNIGFDFPDDWVCEMNTDPSHNRCTAAEQKLNIPEAVFKKEVKTQEMKQQKLEEEIKKKSEMLQKIQKTKPVMSSRQIKDELEEEEKKLAAKSPQLISRQRSAPVNNRPSPSVSRQNSSPVYIPDSDSSLSQSPSPSKARAASQRSNVPSPTPSRKTSGRVQKAEQEKEERAQRVQREREEKARQQAKLDKERAQKAVKERIQRERERLQKEKERERAAKEREKLRVQKEKEKEALRLEREQEKEVLRAEKERQKELIREEKEKQMQIVRHPATSTKASSQTSSDESSSSQVSQSTRGEATKRRATAASTTADAEVPSKKSKAAPTSTKDESDSMEEESAGMTVESSEIEETTISNDDSEGEVGTKVEAKVKDKWYSGSVVKVNAAESKWKVKFDQNPKDKYDKWYEKKGPEVRLLKANQLAPESSFPAPASPASISSHETAAEAPSSSTNTTTAVPPGGQITDEIANGYRTCLRYFLPPQWSMDKEAISALTLQELAAFPLDDFFDHYEKGLRKLVNNFQTESNAAKSKLSGLRKNISRLLRSLNDEIDIDPEEDGEHVDQLLAACVNQATQGQQQE